MDLRLALEFAVTILRDGSTYTRLGLLLAAVGWKIGGEVWGDIALYGMGAGVLLAFLLDEFNKFLARRNPPRHEP